MIAAFNNPATVLFDGMTKSELLEFGRSNNIAGLSAAMNKAEILLRIQEAVM